MSLKGHKRQSSRQKAKIDHVANLDLIEGNFDQSRLALNRVVLNEEKWAIVRLELAKYGANLCLIGFRESLLWV